MNDASPLRHWLKIWRSSPIVSSSLPRSIDLLSLYLKFRWMPSFGGCLSIVIKSIALPIFLSKVSCFFCYLLAFTLFRLRTIFAISKRDKVTNATVRIAWFSKLKDFTQSRKLRFLAQSLFTTALCNHIHCKLIFGSLYWQRVFSRLYVCLWNVGELWLDAQLIELIFLEWWLPHGKDNLY